jgi:uncharacterized protein (DUF952 family)
MAFIYHWCPAGTWDSTVDEYEAPSLAEEGFIHFSHKHQVERTATALHRGQTDLVLLCVDDTTVEVVDEDCYELGEEFPHIYAPIPVASVIAVFPFPSEPDGTFRLPSGLLD